MPRLPRPFQPDSIYHVTDRGVERRPIFVTEEDRRFFMTLLVAALKEARCSLFADCLMPNHFHGLIGVSDVPLGRVFHQALTRYALRFNNAYERVGHLFQARFHSKPVRDLSHLQNVITYIHENPVRANLARTVEEWRWSSHQDWKTLAPGRIDFARFEELTCIPKEEMQAAYLQRIDLMSKGGPTGLSLDQLVDDTAWMLGLEPSSLRDDSRGHLFSRARNIVIDRALKAGFPAIAIAAALNLTPAAVTMARKRR